MSTRKEAYQMRGLYKAAVSYVRRSRRDCRPADYEAQLSAAIRLLAKSKHPYGVQTEYMRRMREHLENMQ